MEVFEMLDLNDCPLCGGNALLEEESGCYYVTCLECGCHTVSIDFKKEADRMQSAQSVADLWNMGKVISGNPGE